jgi:hypothetical protein
VPKPRQIAIRIGRSFVIGIRASIVDTFCRGGIGMRLIGLIAAAGYLAAMGCAAADEVQAISTGGKGDLTMCQGILGQNCNLYHHIDLPPRIAVGDTVPVDFGSNEKQYTFPVARIVKDGDGCTVLSQASGDMAKMDRIKIAACQDAGGPH